eukprot:830736-Rhodomonas_salina.3
MPAATVRFLSTTSRFHTLSQYHTSRSDHTRSEYRTSRYHARSQNRTSHVTAHRATKSQLFDDPAGTARTAMYRDTGIP